MVAAFSKELAEDEEMVVVNVFVQDVADVFGVETFAVQWQITRQNVGQLRRVLNTMTSYELAASALVTWFGDMSEDAKANISNLVELAFVNEPNISVVNDGDLSSDAVTVSVNATEYIVPVQSTTASATSTDDFVSLFNNLALGYIIAIGVSVGCMCCVCPILICCHCRRRRKNKKLNRIAAQPLGLSGGVGVSTANRAWDEPLKDPAKTDVTVTIKHRTAEIVKTPVAMADESPMSPSSCLMYKELVSPSPAADPSKTFNYDQQRVSLFTDMAPTPINAPIHADNTVTAAAAAAADAHTPDKPARGVVELTPVKTQRKSVQEEEVNRGAPLNTGEPPGAIRTRSKIKKTPNERSSLANPKKKKKKKRTVTGTVEEHPPTNPPT